MRTAAGDTVLDPPEPAKPPVSPLISEHLLVTERLPAAMSDSQLSARLSEVFAAEQVLAAQRLTLIAEIDGRGQPRREGATSTTAWLRDTLRVSVGTAAAMLHLARDLATAALSATAHTLADGGINTDQASVITRVISGLPRDLDPDIRARAQRVLLDYAARFAAGDLATLGSRVLSHVAPEVAEQHERRQMEQQEARARRERGFTLSPDGQGRVRLRGLLDTESAATVNAAIGPLCAPSQERRAGKPRRRQPNRPRNRRRNRPRVRPRVRPRNRRRNRPRVRPRVRPRNRRRVRPRVRP